MASIGRVLLKPKGDYSSSATYNNLDWVRYNGKAWVCKVDGTINIVPTEGQNWTLLAQDGSGGGGGASDWDDISYKPFDTLDTTNDFTVDNLDNNKLHIKRDTFGTMRIVSGGTTTDLEASGDSVFEIEAGTNVTITADDSSTPKKITINSSGGGGGSTTFAGLDDTDINNPQADQIVQYKSVGGQMKLQNVAMPQGGHTMLPTPNASVDESAVVSAVKGGITEGGINDDVASLYGVGKWSNTMTKTYKIQGIAGSSTPITQSGIGNFDMTGVDQTGWVTIPALIGSGTDPYLDIKLGFDPTTVSVPITLGGWVVDDSTGKMCIKFGNEIPEADTHTALVTVEVIFKRTEVVSVS